MTSTRSLFTLLLLFCFSQSTSAQWLTTFGPSTNGKQLDAMASIGTNVFAGGYNGAFFWSGDTNWVQDGISPAYVQALAVNGSTLIAGASDGLHFSNDFGANWGFVNDTNFYVFAVAVNGSTVIAGTDVGLHISNDNGQTWNAYNMDGGYFVTVINGSNCFAGGVGVSVSNDNGATWTTPNNALTNANINALAVSGSSLFAGTTAGMYLSMDNGSTWSDATNGLADSNIYAIDIIGPKIFIGTDSGVFVSVNNGGKWLHVNDSLPSYLAVYSFTSDSTYLYAGTGNGVYRRALTEFNGVSDGVRQNVPENALSVYPNPVQQSTTIRFSSQETGLAEVTIVNILGAEVTKIFDDELSDGDHSFNWDATGLPPGMYECIVRINGNSQQIPIMLSR